VCVCGTILGEFFVPGATNTAFFVYIPLSSCFCINLFFFSSACFTCSS
jgi:hypothetical protein